ncbi:hypothetical protein STEG23_026879 [Scotinomys teguina]
MTRAATPQRTPSGPCTYLAARWAGERASGRREPAVHTRRFRVGSSRVPAQVRERPAAAAAATAAATAAAATPAPRPGTARNRYKRKRRRGGRGSAVYLRSPARRRTKGGRGDAPPPAPRPATTGPASLRRDRPRRPCPSPPVTLGESRALRPDPQGAGHPRPLPHLG